MQAPGVQVQASGHQAFVENVERTVLLSNGLDRTQALCVDHLSSTQKEADPFLQPVCLVLEATIARQLLKQLATHAEEGQKTK